MSHIREFIRHEASGGLMLMGTALLALLCVNIPGSADIYLSITPPMVKLIVNDGLMTIFFLLVGLELKRECLIGELAGRQRILQPLFAALGGMIVPVMVYLVCVQGEASYRTGWAIPAATDIAFALGVITLLGSRVPQQVKIMLTAIAILDDIGAIAIIAVFYSHGLAAWWLALAVMATGILYLLNRRHVIQVWPYLLMGAVVWLGFFKGGLHPTLAGVVTAMFVPLYDKTDAAARPAPLGRLEHNLHPLVAFAILPLFAFTNAGLVLHGLAGTDIMRPVTLGILLGLCLGKPIGVLVGLWIGRLAGMVRAESISSYAAMACFCGIGFTMSLFINELAFTDPALQNQAKLGVLLASVLAAVAGSAITFMFERKGR